MSYAQRRFRRLFVRWWITLAVLAALPMACVGYAFSTYRSPETVADYALLTYCFVAAPLAASPMAALLGLLMAASQWSLMAWWHDHVAANASESWATTGDSCGQCGYSLTGNLSGRCPECGTPVSHDEGPRRFWLMIVLINVACWPVVMVLDGVVTWLWRR